MFIRIIQFFFATKNQKWNLSEVLGSVFYITYKNVTTP